MSFETRDRVEATIVCEYCGIKNVINGKSSKSCKRKLRNRGWWVGKLHSCPKCSVKLGNNKPEYTNGCPFCGSKRAPTISDEKTSGISGEVFASRRGCLDCNTWWDPVVIQQIK